MRVMTCPPSMSAAMVRHSHFGGLLAFSHASVPVGSSVREQSVNTPRCACLHVKVPGTMRGRHAPSQQACRQDS